MEGLPTREPPADRSPIHSSAKSERRRSKFRKSIKSAVTVHDRTQIETVFDYSLPKAEPGAAAELRYQVEAFLFFPRQFGLDAATYPKERFYNDIRPLIRFREPKLGYRQLLGQKKPAPSPLVFLREFLDRAKSGQLPEPVRNAVDEIRLFACAFVGNYIRDLDRIRRRCQKARGRSLDGEHLLEIFGRATRTMDRAHRLLLELRELIPLSQQAPADVCEPVETELKLIDEYCYYRLRDGLAHLLLSVESLAPVPEKKWEPDDEPYPHLSSAIVLFEERVRQLVAFHDDYARRVDYILVHTDSPEDLKERYLHRRGELKRRIWAVLFLEIRQVPMFRLQRQLGAMVAAGLAAFWAVIAQVIIVRKALLSESRVDLWGVSGFLFLTAGVLAYVVKDRIKEIGRGYLGRGGIFGRVPDNSEKIYSANRQGDPVEVGALKESTRFLRLEEVPKTIGVLRSQLVAGDSLEDEVIDRVLQYTKHIELSGMTMILNRYPLRAIHDILRFNIEACLPRLGEPVRIISVVDSDGDVQPIAFPKVYYLDMALRYSRLDQRRSDDQVIQYFRLVLDKTGLQRVEQLA